MAGNFSFGDYFKEGAITSAWELLTASQDDGGYGFDGDRLWPTVYQDDDEAYDIWRRVIGVPEDADPAPRDGRQLLVDGRARPVRPVLGDLLRPRARATAREGGPVVDEERYLEVWNLVFMQYERGPGAGKEGFPILGELPKKNIDTGMGVERMAYLLQGRENLYEIDEVFPVLARAAELTGRAYGSDPGADVRLRVVADHVRSALMIMADGVTPANEGRGYVLRRLLRRVVRSIRLLGYQDAVAARAAAGVPGRDGAVVPGGGRRLRAHLHLRVRGGGDLRPDAAGRHGDPGHRGPGDQAGRRRDAVRASRRSSCTTRTGSRST